MKVSRSLLEQLEQNEFTGQLIGAYELVWNFASEDSRVVSLVRASLGMGPFAVMLPDAVWPDSPPEEIRLNPASLHFDTGALALAGAEVWEPIVDWPEFQLAKIKLFQKDLLKFSHWRVLRKQPKAMAMALSRRASDLLAALAIGDEINEVIPKMVGLGNGLTPAGDDYLLGYIAALHYSHSDLAKQIKLPQKLLTTKLSGAFLQAAVHGEFVQSWHDLAEAIRLEDSVRFAEAVSQIEQYGATSGVDALAGFSQTLLLLAD